MSYLIKLTYKATENNTLFYGKEKACQVMVRGKYDSNEDLEEYLSDLKEQNYFNQNYAYSNLIDAKKEAIDVCNYEKECGWWDTTYEIMTI